MAIRLIFEIEFSNPAEGLDVRLVCLLCAVYVAASANARSLVQRSPTVCVCVCVCFIICVCVSVCVILYVCDCMCVRVYVCECV